MNQHQESSRRTLLVLATLGAGAAGWAIFLWLQLLRARAGGTPTCAFGGSDCTRLWDAAFATAVHGASGVPVAGWGLVWGLVATALPLLALRRTANAGVDVAATRLTGLAGLAGVGALLLASAQAGAFCSSCAITYLLTTVYGLLAFAGLGGALLSGAGLARAATAAVMAFALVLVPGWRTPKSTQAAGQQVVADAAAEATRDTAEAASTTPSAAAEPGDALRAFLADLPAPMHQPLADSLEIMRQSPPRPTPAPRAPHGEAAAAVIITTFTDTLCSHCADLHNTLGYMMTALPGRFLVDARQFPLDGRCNAYLQPRDEDSPRCLAAKAQICLETAAGSFAFASALYERQQSLTEAMVYQLAAPYLARPELDACVAAPATAAKLREDVDYAWRYRPPGTPVVLINGRLGTAFGPFLYAIVLAGGDVDHPAFADLPPPGQAGS